MDSDAAKRPQRGDDEAPHDGEKDARRSPLGHGAVVPAKLTLLTLPRPAVVAEREGSTLEAQKGVDEEGSHALQRPEAEIWQVC